MKNKNLIRSLLFLFVMLFGMELYAQEQTRNVVLFTELNSGTLVNDTDGIFAGNDVEAGVCYRQNFVTAPWLSVYFKGAFSGGVDWINRNLSTRVDAYLFPEWELNGSALRMPGVHYLEAGVTFSDYGYIAVRQNLMIKAYVFAPINFGGIHKVTFLIGIEAMPYFIGRERLSDTVELDPTDHSIKVFAAGINYNVQFHQNWSYSTELQYRSHGGGSKTASGDNIWEVDSIKALKFNSYFRWDNTLSFNINNITLWGQVRYLPSYFVKNEWINNRNNRIKHDVQLRMGFAYNFDLLNLANS